VASQRFECVEIGLGVHIGEQEIGLSESREFGTVDAANAQLVEQVSHAQLPLPEPAPHRSATRLRVNRTQGMIAAFGPWHDSVGIRHLAGQVPQQRSGEEGHIAGEQQHVVVTRSLERGFEAAERSAAVRPVAESNRAWRDGRVVSVPDEQDTGGNGAQGFELPLEDGPAPEAQLTLVTPAEPLCLSTSEDCRARHLAAILSGFAAA